MSLVCWFVAFSLYSSAFTTCIQASRKASRISSTQSTPKVKMILFLFLPLTFAISISNYSFSNASFASFGSFAKAFFNASLHIILLNFARLTYKRFLKRFLVYKLKRI